MADTKFPCKFGQAKAPAPRGPFDYWRRLPHWHPDQVPMFVTWRLFGSLPRAAGRAFVDADRELDCATSGPMWLADRRVADLVVEALHAGEERRGFYHLDAYAVLSNHVHLVLLPSVKLPVITRWLKGSTARRANQILCRTGAPFWQDESYDHWIRNRDEWVRIVQYVESNPVSAGLARNIEDWPWSSARTARAGESACPT